MNRGARATPDPTFVPASAIVEASGPHLGDGEWRQWLGFHFPRLVQKPLAPRHVRLWEWFEALHPGAVVRPRVEVWPRGGAKSTTGETATVRVGCRVVEHEGEKRPLRRFVLYVSGTQDQAVKHLTAISAKFEQLNVGRALGKYGQSKGWKTDVLRTETGFNVMAMGLEAEARGAKLDDFRPDLIIFDDIDSRHDSPAVIKRKIEIIKDSILPSGSPDCAILFLQNKIHEDSIVSMLCDGRADFLHTREPAFIEPAVYDLETEQRQLDDGTYRYSITSGRASWDGQDLATCEKQINDWGLSSFLRESQHETDEVEDGLWKRDDINRNRIMPGDELPPMERIVVGVDPPGTTGRAGIIVKGRATINGKKHYYTLADYSPEKGASPGTWARRTLDAYEDYEADAVVVEVNMGGAMVKHTIRQTDGGENVKIIEVRATRGKVTRAEPCSTLSEEGREHHVGRFEDLEKQKCSYHTGDDSPDQMDADVWATTELMGAESKKIKSRARSGGFVTSR